jgi:hypothetical protein
LSRKEFAMTTLVWFRIDEIIPVFISGWILALRYVRQRLLGLRLFHVSAMS